MKQGNTVAILFRKDEKIRSVEGYAIHGMIDYWRKHGIRVEYVFGPQRKIINADLLFVHVNLSVVPPAYLDYTRQYPHTLNARIYDIRKTTVCDHLLTEGDSYQGPVIVKSDLNAAGVPERKARQKIFRQVQNLFQWGASPKLLIKNQQDYRFYDSVAEVPASIFHDKKLVVQKFLPENVNGLYYVRNYHFLGDRFSCVRLSSRDPLISLQSTQSVEIIEPHPDIVAIRRRLNMEYGKLDYTIHNERVVLLDVNKTTGVRRNESSPTILAMRKERAKGIFPYLGLQAPDD